MMCALKNNKVVPCAGEFVLSEGLCLKHAVLFDVWICEHEGFRVYQSDYPRRWKRSKVHKWLNEIGNEKANKILNS